MDIPEFVENGAFNWSSRGYHYIFSEEELCLVESGVTVENPWLEIARVVEHAKIGNFATVGSLARFFDTDLATNAAPAAMLITGNLGCKQDIEALVQVMHDGPDGFRVYACQAARNAGCLWLIPPMLEAWHHRSKSVDAHENIGFAIADLLDPIRHLDDEGEVASRAGRFTIPTEPKSRTSELEQLAVKTSDPGASKEFSKLVLRRWNEVAASCSDEQTAIWAGAITDVRAFAEHFLRMISAETFTLIQTPLTVPLREKFEASSGVDCSDFYRDGIFHQLTAVATLESFLDSTIPNRFETGQRYFFGHRIAD